MKIFSMKRIIIGIALVLLLIFGFLFYWKNNNFEEVTNEETNFLAEATTVKEKTTSKKIKAEVKGEVNTPGVYEFDEEGRLEDLINAAGGFKDNAYYDNINLSKKLSDEMVVYVYDKKTMKNSKKLSAQTTTSSDCVCQVKDYNIDSCIENKESVIVTGATSSTSSTNSSSKETTPTSSSNASSSSTTQLVNINTASLSELTTLSGIGDAKAQKIIDYRNEFGAFQAIEDLMNVSGIGQAMYDKIKANITI